MFWQLKQQNTKGNAAEALALKHLKAQGLKLIQKNYACRFGELDLVMLEQDTLIFVEVRFRTQSHYGSAIESITPNKVQKIRITANHFLQNFPSHQHRLCRFDVVSINTDKSNNIEDQKNVIEWLKGAFQ